jgi:predicted peptidase
LKLEHCKHGALEFALRPPLLSATTRPPLLCFLHGHDEGAPTALTRGVTAHGPLMRGASRRAGEFVVVAPPLPVRGDYWHRHAQGVRAVVMEVCRRLEADPAQLYLTGFSFGGNGVFDIGVEGAVHSVGEVTRAYADDRIYDWLLSWRSKAAE